MVRSGPKSFSKLVRLLKASRRNDRGNAAMIFAFAFLPMLAAVGLSVDGGRVFMVKSQLSSAVDVTALTATRLFTDPERDAKATEFFRVNFTADRGNVTLDPLNIVSNIDGTDKIVTVTGKAHVATLFMKIFGIPTVTVSESGKASRSEAPIELVMALDNTGSMAISTDGVSRLAALKSAATTLINSLYGLQDTSSNIRIGIIPYTSYVNVGRLPEITGEPAFVTPVAGYTDRPVTDALGWKGCVDADASNANAGSNMADSAWDSALDTQDKQPAAPMKASLFPSFGIMGTQDTMGCPAGEWIRTTTVDRNEFITQYSCNEGVCGSRRVPNPDYNIVSPIEYCGVPEVVVGVESNPIFSRLHVYNTGGLDSVFGRPNPSPAGFVDGLFLTYNYVNASSTERPALPYASRATDRTSNSIPPIIYTADTPTSDNYTDASVDPQNINSYSDPYSAASPNTYCPEQALPLNQHDKSTVLSYINTKLKAFFPDWGTMSNQGLVWSWRMLSPALPLAGQPNNAGFTKSVILMTDGSLYHPSGSDTDWDRNIKLDSIRTPYGFGSEKRLVNNANPTRDALALALQYRLRKTCQNIRRAGIMVYTVTFDPTMSAASKNEYRNCASKPSMYFDAPDAATLNAAFTAIADNISAVRLVQ